MRHVWLSPVLFLAITLTACQASVLSMPVPQEPAAQTDPGGPLPESSATQVPTSAPSQEEVDMVPVTPPDEASAKMVALVKGHLSHRLNIPVDQIVLSEIKPVIWRDASLGCPKPGIDYIRVETPGYAISLSAGGKTYTYHTDETKRFVQCNK